jgi:hypothetical protein
MQSLTTTETTAPEARARVHAGWTSGRVVSVVVGSVLALCALGGLAGGGVLAVGGVDVELGAHGRYHTPGYALVSDSTNWRTQLFGAVGSVSFRATADGAKPIFVGAARPALVRRYLHGIRFTTVHGDGHVVQHDGTAPTTAPGAAVDWTAQSTGIGTQTLRWDRDEGEQVLVAMNTDGTPSVSARVVSSTVTLRTMPTLAAGLLAGGAVLLALSIAFIAIPVRRARDPRRGSPHTATTQI